MSRLKSYDFGDAAVTAAEHTTTIWLLYRPLVPYLTPRNIFYWSMPASRLFRPSFMASGFLADGEERRRCICDDQHLPSISVLSANAIKRVMSL